MSLDVYLTTTEVRQSAGTGVFVRDNGATRELSEAEVRERFPGHDIVLGVRETNEVYSANITHNLGKMAAEAGIYEALWRPEEIGITKAAQLVPLLRDGLAQLRARPEHFQQFNSPNGWGVYEHFVPFVEKYLAACEANPEADVSVWR